MRMDGRRILRVSQNLAYAAFSIIRSPVCEVQCDSICVASSSSSEPPRQNSVINLPTSSTRATCSLRICFRRPCGKGASKSWNGARRTGCSWTWGKRNLFVSLWVCLTLSHFFSLCSFFRCSFIVYISHISAIWLLSQRRTVCWKIDQMFTPLSWTNRARRKLPQRYTNREQPQSLLRRVDVV